MRAFFILQYKPELLGKLAEVLKLENHDEESVKLKTGMERAEKMWKKYGIDSIILSMPYFFCKLSPIISHILPVFYL